MSRAIAALLLVVGVSACTTVHLDKAPGVSSYDPNGPVNQVDDTALGQVSYHLEDQPEAYKTMRDACKGPYEILDASSVSYFVPSGEKVIVFIDTFRCVK